MAALAVVWAVAEEEGVVNSFFYKVQSIISALSLIRYLAVNIVWLQFSHFNLRGTKMKQSLFTITVLALFTGCATWHGVKQDTSTAVEWSKEKVNQSAGFVKEKTE